MKNDIKTTVANARAALVNNSVDPEKLENILDELIASSKNATPWWVIVLKTLAYLIGLLLAGYGTSAAAQTMFM